MTDTKAIDDAQTVWASAALLLAEEEELACALLDGNYSGRHDQMLWQICGAARTLLPDDVSDEDLAELWATLEGDGIPSDAADQMLSIMDAQSRGLPRQSVIRRTPVRAIDALRLFTRVVRDVAARSARDPLAWARSRAVAIERHRWERRPA